MMIHTTNHFHDVATADMYDFDFHSYGMIGVFEIRIKSNFNQFQKKLQKNYTPCTARHCGSLLRCTSKWYRIASKAVLKNMEFSRWIVFPGFEPQCRAVFSQR